MTFANWVLVAVAVFAILGALGAFTIAFRRTRARTWRPFSSSRVTTRDPSRPVVRNLLIRYADRLLICARISRKCG